MIVIVALMKAREGQADEMAKALRDYPAKFRKDPGVNNYQIHRGVENPNTFLFYEQYADEDGLRFHRAAPHSLEMFRAMKPFLDGKGEVSTYKEI